MFSKRVLILSFLAIAEELQLKGFIRKIDEKVEKSLSSTFWPEKIQKLLFTGRHPTEISTILENIEHCPFLETILGTLGNLTTRWIQWCQNPSANGHQFADICKVCGKEGHGRDIRNHIEANHLEGVVIPCNLCDKTFRSRNSFRTHKSRQHTNKFACSQNWFKFKLLKPLWWSFWVQKCFETS